MALRGWFRSDIDSHGIAGDDRFDLRWDRILFANGVPAVHFGPAAVGNIVPAADGHGEPTMTAPIDSNAAPDSDAGGAAQVAAPHADAASPSGDTLLNPFWDPPYFALEALPDSAAVPTSVPGAGLLSKAEALIWSGPAIVVFPGDGHDAPSDATVPDPSGAPGTADLPDAVTRADLDPVLAAQGGGNDHAASADSGGGDLSAAFLPGGSDPAGLPHGLDPGFAFTPQPPLPPPTDVIG